jgi:hypothetical protein
MRRLHHKLREINYCLSWKSYDICEQWCTNHGRSVARESTFCTVVLKACGSWLWSLVFVTLLAPRILRWFWKICAPLFVNAFCWLNALLYCICQNLVRILTAAPPPSTVFKLWRASCACVRADVFFSSVKVKLFLVGAMYGEVRVVVVIQPCMQSIWPRRYRGPTSPL